MSPLLRKPLKIHDLRDISHAIKAKNHFSAPYDHRQSRLGCVPALLLHPLRCCVNDKVGTFLKPVEAVRNLHFDLHYGYLAGSSRIRRVTGLTLPYNVLQPIITVDVESSFVGHDGFSWSGMVARVWLMGTGTVGCELVWNRLCREGVKWVRSD